jgi:hypothetical protein
LLAASANYRMVTWHGGGFGIHGSTVRFVYEDLTALGTVELLNFKTNELVGYLRPSHTLQLKNIDCK